MFQKNDYIFHGGSGVCIVGDICTPPHTKCRDSTRQYYRLHPLYEANSVIYTPIDSPKGIVRKILSKAEAVKLIEEIPSIEPLELENDKMREEKYRQALRSNDCYEWIRVIKTVWLRNEARKNEGKRANQVDEKYFQTAETLLYGELAVPIGIPREEVREYIADRIRQTSAGSCS